VVYPRVVRRPLALLAVSLAAAACTETPDSFPPCVDPNAPCAAYDAGEEAAADATATDGAGHPQDTGGGDVTTGGDGSPVDGAGSEASADAAPE
jgi:hypothetical protein